MIAGHPLARLCGIGVALCLGTACANQSLPPGGAPDGAPPQIVRITPENNAVTPRARDVEVRFNEVISETPSGVRDLADLVFISPRSGTPRVNWNRTSISIRPSKGWKPNTVYSLQIAAGIADLRNNIIDSTIRLVFSTGGPIPDTHISGVAFDWAGGKPLVAGVVEALAGDADSTTYQAVTDQKGRFDLRNLPSGPYLMRAYADANKNRTLDPLEPWDSVRVTLTQSASAEFYAFGHDTVGLRISQLEVTDSNRVIKVVFDKPYSPNQFFVDGSVVLKNKDSAVVRVRSVQTAFQRIMADSAKKLAVADSLRRAAEAKDAELTAAQRARLDSLASVRRADSIAAVQATARRRRLEEERQARASGRRFVPPDTTPPPKMNRPTVYTEIFITVDSALPPQSQFRLQVNGVRSLGEVVRPAARSFTTARRDTMAKRDTTAQRDTTVRRDTLASRQRR